MTANHTGFPLALDFGHGKLSTNTAFIDLVLKQQWQVINFDSMR
jgi:hypothetical protein